MPARRFRKLPVTIEAIRFTGDNTVEVGQFIGDEQAELYEGTHSKLAIETLEGPVWASVGDWIIRGVNGEHYPCRADIFEKTCEPAED